jgi:hypothetical protein
MAADRLVAPMMGASNRDGEAGVEKKHDIWYDDVLIARAINILTQAGDEIRDVGTTMISAVEGKDLGPPRFEDEVKSVAAHWRVSTVVLGEKLGEIVKNISADIAEYDLMDQRAQKKFIDALAGIPVGTEDLPQLPPLRRRDLGGPVG